MTHEELKALAQQILKLEPLAHVPRGVYCSVAEGYLALSAQLEEARAELGENRACNLHTWKERALKAEEILAALAVRS